MNKKLSLLVLVVVAAFGMYFIQKGEPTAVVEVIPGEIEIIGEDYNDLAEIFGFSRAVSLKTSKKSDKKVIKLSKKDRKMLKKVFGFKNSTVSLKGSSVSSKKFAEKSGDKFKLTKKDKKIFAKTLGFSDQEIVSLKLEDDKKSVKYSKEERRMLKKIFGFKQAVSSKPQLVSKSKVPNKIKKLGKKEKKHLAKIFGFNYSTISLKESSNAKKVEKEISKDYKLTKKQKRTLAKIFGFKPVVDNKSKGELGLKETNKDAFISKKKANKKLGKIQGFKDAASPTTNGNDIEFKLDKKQRQLIAKVFGFGESLSFKTIDNDKTGKKVILFDRKENKKTSVKKIF